MLFRSVERTEHLFGRAKGAVNAPALYVLERLREAFFDERLRSEDHLVIAQLDLQKIARLKAQPVMNPLGDNDLAAGSQLDDRRDTGDRLPLCLCFHIIVFYKASLAESTACRSGAMPPPLVSIDDGVRGGQGCDWPNPDELRG